MNELKRDQMYPEVRIYLESIENGEKDYQEKYDATCDMPQDTDAEWQAARNARREANKEWNDLRDAAWEKLADSQVPLISWISKNTASYKDHALVILKALTPETTLSEMDDLAREHDWCYVWGDFKSKAIADGVFPPEDVTVQMRVNGGEWQEFWEHRGPNGANLTKDMINRLMAAGVSFISMDVGRDHVMYQRVNNRDNNF